MIKLMFVMMSFSIISFANDFEKIEKTTKAIEDTYSVKCEFTKNTMKKCLGMLPAFYQTFSPQSCMYAKKYTCSNSDINFQIKYNLKEVTTFKTVTTTLLKAIVNTEDKVITTQDMTINNTVDALALNFNTKCEFKKNTIGMCLGGADMNYGTVGGLCYFSKKYICHDGTDKIKILAKVKEMIGFGNQDATLRKFVIKY